MSYGIRGKGKERETRLFFEKAYRREPLAAWDAKWQELTVQARYFVLEVVKSPAKEQFAHSLPPSVAAEKFPLHVLSELVNAGFIKVQVAKSRALTDRVIACDGLYDFVTRIRCLRRFHLLASEQPSEFEKYVDYAFNGSSLVEVISGVLRKAGIEDNQLLNTTLQHYVMHFRWPGWVELSLQDPLSARILDVFQEAKAPILLAELAGRLKGSNPDALRSALDKLVTHLALVEDLKPETWEIMLGFLPAVREELICAERPRTRPELVAVEHPKELGPNGSVILNDVRAVLLEVVSDPPRLRQDQQLFQKEIERFLAPLEPLPGWFMKALKWTADGRVNQAISWARSLELVKETSAGKELQLNLTSKGHKWLSSSLDEQFSGIYSLIINPPASSDIYAPHLRWFFPGLDAFSNFGPEDVRFLGEFISVVKAEKGVRYRFSRDMKPEDRQALRTSLDKALSTLKPGVFYRLDSVESHLTFEKYNPLNRGLDPKQVTVYWRDRQVPPLEEQREEAGRYLIDRFVFKRLIPLGCVRAGIDDQDRIVIAREPRFDALFGRKVASAEVAPASTAAARVVVQPDFSVIVIGLNPAPAAELVPFCERISQAGSQGAMILKVTRDSVVKAVSQGLMPAEIVARLQRLASNAVPANVLREVQEWSGWARNVKTSTLTVLRCPDRETADRVMEALKRQAERLNDTLVAIDQKKLTATERNKLRTRGIIVQSHSDANERKPKSRKKRW